jgi:hypothetical protein
MTLEWKKQAVLPAMDQNGLFLTTDRDSLNSYRCVCVDTNHKLYSAIWSRPSSSKGYRMYTIAKYEDERVAAFIGQEFAADKKAQSMLEDAINMGRDEEFIDMWLGNVVGPIPEFASDSIGYTKEGLELAIADRDARCGDQKRNFPLEALRRQFANDTLPPAPLVPHMVAAVQKITESEQISYTNAAKIVAETWRAQRAAA